MHAHSSLLYAKTINERRGCGPSRVVERWLSVFDRQMKTSGFSPAARPLFHPAVKRVAADAEPARRFRHVAPAGGDGALDGHGGQETQVLRRVLRALPGGGRALTQFGGQIIGQMAPADPVLVVV